jgi:DNA-binding transcriptional LysR family regulator
MDLRHLKTFVAVADHGTVSKAAQILRITQPALSRQIRRMEDEIGFELFERTGRRVLLTARGEQFLGDCRGVLHQAGALDERAHALRRGEIRSLSVVASALTIEAIFPTFLHRYAKRVPGVRLALIDAEATEHLAMLEQGGAHLAINVINVLPVDDQRFATRMLPRFQLLAAAAPTFGMGQDDAIDISDLVRHPLLLLWSRSASRNIFDSACKLADVRPNIFLESGAVHPLLSLAAAGHGVAVIPSILRTDPRQIRVRPITHKREALQVTLAVLWNRRRMPTRYAEEFSDLLAEFVRETFSVLPAPKANPRSSAVRKVRLR